MPSQIYSTLFIKHKHAQITSRPLIKKRKHRIKSSFGQGDSSQNLETETENARERGRKEVILRNY